MAPRNARNGPDHGPFRGWLHRRPERRGGGRLRAPRRRPGSGNLGLDQRRTRSSRRIRRTDPPALACVSLPRLTKKMARPPAEQLLSGRPLTLSGVADGAEGLVLADLARSVAARPDAPATSLPVGCRHGPRMAQLSHALAFFAPDVDLLEFPAWDCQPYDRVSPHAGIVAQRMTALSRLARVKGRERPAVLLTTVNAVLPRGPAKQLIASQALSAAPGNMIAMDGILRWLERKGYMRASTVREPGDYAVRGGILDLYPPGMADPVRLDFFGDTLESIRSFDPESQRTIDQLRGLDLVPVAEFQLTTETIRRFRTGYVEA